MTASLVETAPLQRPAGVRFEIVHHLLGFFRRHHNNVDMAAPNVECPECPATITADLSNRFKYNCPAWFVEFVRRFPHPGPRDVVPGLVERHCSPAGQVVVTIDRTGAIAV